MFYSAFKAGDSAKVLVIDNIGMLAALYRYGEIAAIGGGYSRSGIHNVLEPAIFGFAFPAADPAAYARILQSLITGEEGRIALQALIRSYVQNQAGATAKILSLLNVAT